MATMATARSPETSTRPQPSPPSRQGDWALVMPVKGGPAAKSRLARDDRAALARAVALDAVAAALACPVVTAVVVVTGDERCAREHAALGATVLPDPGLGLTAALLAGTTACHPSGPCALLLADLPALRPADLQVTLDRALALLTTGPVGHRMVTVPDADGDGTVLLAARRPGDLRPRFGAGSARAHARVACVLTDVPACVRRDVDTAEHLRDAVALGVGLRTAQVLSGQPRSTIAPSDASFSPNRS